MESVFDGNLFSRVMISVATIGYGFITIKVDFNATHATNPLWTPHARFHVVWQMLSYCGIALAALWLIWGGAQALRLYLAGALGVAVYGGFFLAAAGRRLFGGALYDENGYPPFRLKVAGRQFLADVNMTAFSILSAILAVGIAGIRP